MSFRTAALLLAGCSLCGPACGGESMFTPPPQLVGELGDYRSPLLFDDGRPVETPAQWEQRRREIRRAWDRLLGPWPAVIERPNVETLGTSQRDGYEQRRVRFELAPDHPTEGYLLIPPGDAPRPAALVVYYEPETAVGDGKPHRDFARQLARRGFVTLSVGCQPSLYYPSREDAELQPLSALAYGAANAYHVLAAQPEVDADRVAVVGHSYGGKWALFAACLYDKFAAGVWSDPGVVFDESRPSVNYWEPWYLGYEPAPPPAEGANEPAAEVPPQHRRWGAGRARTASGPPTAENPAFGAYPELIRQGRDLHELHALMAPRPFLVSGGAEDPTERWRALNHSVAVNRLLGYENRVAMTNRPEHAPNEESNAQIAAFLERFLKPGAGD
ncbi:prolyl oligopeptidase family serine peptidase [Alienimonas sp. DA493]|uniref:prolyl oligopeptidase family serine peptidase n=1 Tax=Alienimonas sp. DA493 TaxID=3373605 RepID=UPI0037551DF6